MIAPNARTIRLRVGGWIVAGLAMTTVACTPAPAHATIYYVDYASGSDTASGRTPEAAWKHAPGDPKAGGAVKAQTLAPGDTVRFRGGVVYRGNVVVPADGADGRPITYAGDQWGSQPAIFSGADAVRSIEPCPSAEACGGSIRWANLSVVQFDLPKTQMIKFFDSAGMLYESQFPKVADPFISDDIDEYVEVPLSAAEGVMRGELRSPVLARALAAGAEGANISIWSQGNRVSRRPILAIEGDTLRFSAEGLKPYDDRPGKAAVLNAPGLIDGPGQYAVVAPGRAVAWLRGPGPLLLGSGRGAIDVRGRSNITIKGFTFENYAAGKYGEGVQVTNSGTPIRNLSVEGNTFRHSALYTGSGVIMIGKVNGARIVGNNFSDIERGSGIRTNQKPVSNLLVENNTFSRLGRTGILIMGSSDVVLSKNRMEALYGLHGNGISLYLDNRRVTVADNTILGASRPMTFHGDKDGKTPGDHEFVIERNTFAASDPKAGAIISFGNTRNVTIRENILIGERFGLLLSPKDSGVVVTGNHTATIHTKGDQPSGWVIKDNDGLSRTQIAAAKPPKR